MSNSSNRRYIAIGLEDANGDVTGPMPVIETLSGFSIKPNGDVKTRDITRASMSQVGGVVGAKNWDVEVPVEMNRCGVRPGRHHRAGPCDSPVTDGLWHGG